MDSNSLRYDMLLYIYDSRDKGVTREEISRDLEVKRALVYNYIQWFVEKKMVTEVGDRSFLTEDGKLELIHATLRTKIVDTACLPVGEVIRYRVGG